MPKRYEIKLIGIFLILFTMLACTINIGGPSYPDRIIPISTEYVETLDLSIIQAATAGVTTGSVVITFTEPQLTSFLALKLEQQDEPIFSNPQVFLQDEQIQIYGTASQGYFQATIAIILTVGIDDAGQLLIEFTSADFGPLPVPEGFANTITALINEAFMGSIGPIATGIRLTNISIASGELTVIGQIK